MWLESESQTAVAKRSYVAVAGQHSGLRHAPHTQDLWIGNQVHASTHIHHQETAHILHRRHTTACQGKDSDSWVAREYRSRNTHEWGMQRENYIRV